MIDNNHIVRILRTILDPKTGKDIIQAGLISDLKIIENNVGFTLDATSMDPDVRFSINASCTELINKEYPNAQVHIHMKSLSKSGSKSDNLGQVKNIIAVASGKGGVGKSTISVNLALGLAKQGFKVGLIDADLYGPSIPTMLGLQGKRPKIKDVHGKHKIEPLEAHGIHVMSIGFIVAPEQAVVLRGPRLSGVIKQFVNDCLWPDLDYLIFDLPPGTGDIQLTLIQTVPVTGAIIVTTPQEVAVVDAVKAMNMFLLDNINVPILGIVENMSWFTPKELPDKKYYVFGQGGGQKLADMAKVALLGQVPLVQSVRESGDRGMPSILTENIDMKDIFNQIAAATVISTERRNKTIDATQKVKITT